MEDPQKLYDIVQQNCHISDGLHAQDYGLCTYLLKMRELYRWEKKLPLSAKLPQEEIGKWLSEREQLWENLADKSFACIPINDHCYDPFETATINQILLPQGLVYSAGYGIYCKPLFFIGRLLRRERREGLEIFIAADEYARDLTAPPAMSQGTTIFVRRESVRRLLWEKLETWKGKKNQNHLVRLLETYHTHQDIETALDQMSDDQIETMIDHEIGEVQAGKLLGEKWEKMLIEISGSRAELIARAVRDHLADCLVTLPKLLERTQPVALWFYFLNLKGMRQALFPSLVTALQQWLEENKNLDVLTEIVEKGQTYWFDTAQSFLTCYTANTADSATFISNNFENLSF